MNAPAAGFLVAAAVVAVVDWFAVHRERRTLEYVAKPLTLVLLLGLAWALDPHDPTVRAWFVVALALSLAGDVLLMLPRDFFVPGLAAFLVAHVAYVVGLLVDGVDPVLAAAGVLVVAAGAVGVGRPLVRGVRDSAPALAPPVVAYMAVISAMVVCAIGTGRPLAAAGALAFYVSDALIGWGRFVRAVRWGRVAVMVTYHVAQALLVLSLI